MQHCRGVIILIVAAFNIDISSSFPWQKLNGIFSQASRKYHFVKYKHFRMNLGYFHRVRYKLTCENTNARLTNLLGNTSTFKMALYSQSWPGSSYPKAPAGLLMLQIWSPKVLKWQDADVLMLKTSNKTKQKKPHHLVFNFSVSSLHFHFFVWLPSLLFHMKFTRETEKFSENLMSFHDRPACLSVISHQITRFRLLPACRSPSRPLTLLFWFFYFLLSPYSPHSYLLSSSQNCTRQSEPPVLSIPFIGMIVIVALIWCWWEELAS